MSTEQESGQYGVRQVSSPWGIPGKVDDDVDTRIGGYKQDADKDIDSTGNKAGGNTRGLEKEQLDTDPTSLNKNQNANYAKEGGQYGRFNNRDYSTTLRLAREADRYNNKPIEHVHHIGHWRGSGIQDLGTGYDRPNIETMETRAMDQTISLDTQQKTLAIQLQDAVNHKDLEAFQMLYKQLYGIELDKMQAQLEMTKWSHQQQMQQLFTKDMQSWTAYFTRAFNTQTAAYIMNQVESNPMWASMLAQVVGGYATPSQEEYVLQGVYDSIYAQELAATHDPLQAQQNTELKIMQSQLFQSNQTEQMVKQMGKRKQTKIAKKNVKGMIAEDS